MISGSGYIEMRSRTQRRSERWLSSAALMAGLVLSVGIPAWITQSVSNDRSSHWQRAVYRFDTGLLFSCEAFVRELARPPSPDDGTMADRWERIPPKPPRVRVSPDCLVQAGLMVL